MSLFDNLKKKLGGSSSSLRSKASEVVDKHGDSIASGIDKAGERVSRATQGKYDDKISKATGKAKEGLDRLDDKPDGDTPGGPDGPTSPPRV